MMVNTWLYAHYSLSLELPTSQLPHTLQNIMVTLNGVINILSKLALLFSTVPVFLLVFGPFPLPQLSISSTECQRLISTTLLPLKSYLIRHQILLNYMSLAISVFLGFGLTRRTNWSRALVPVFFSVILSLKVPSYVLIFLTKDYLFLDMSSLLKMSFPISLPHLQFPIRLSH